MILIINAHLEWYDIIQSLSRKVFYLKTSTRLNIQYLLTIFFVKISVQLPSDFCRKGPNSCFHGGTIFNYETTCIIWVENHISLGAGEPSRKNDDLRSDYGSIILQRYSIIIDIMEILMQICFANTVPKGVNIKVFLALYHSIRSLVQSVQFSP